MSDPKKVAFDAQHAEAYDDSFAPVHAFKDALHLLLRAHLAPLPERARILSAGAGTGAEVRLLAPLFPGWHFTLVDPSGPMLAVAERHIAPFADRCTLKVGYVSDLDDEPFDGATSVFVSHFLVEESARRAFFGDIARRLRPGGRLFVADLAGDLGTAELARQLDLWLDLLQMTGVMSKESAQGFGGLFGTAVAAHTPAQVCAFLRDAGFSAITPCFQAALMRGWTAVRS